MADKESVEEKKFMQALLIKVISGINFNTIFTAVCGVIIVALQTCNHSETLNKVNENEQKTDVVTSKQWKNSGKMDSLNKKVDYIILWSQKQDSLKRK